VTLRAGTGRRIFGLYQFCYAAIAKSEKRVFFYQHAATPQRMMMSVDYLRGKAIDTGGNADVNI